MKKIRSGKKKTPARKKSIAPIHTHPLFSIVIISLFILVVIAATRVLAAKPLHPTGFELEDVTNSGAIAVAPPNGAGTFAMTKDGNYIAFTSDASNLGVTNGYPQYFVRNRAAGTTELVSILPDGSQHVGAVLPWVYISGDGRYVAFMDHDNIYLRDRTTQTTSQLPPTQLRYMTPDARYIVYLARTSNDTIFNYWVYDRQTNTAEELSVNNSSVESDATQGSDNGQFTQPMLSDDGRYFVFVSDATNLVPNHPTRKMDIYIRDRVAGTTSLVYPNGLVPNDNSDSPRISADARYVVFHSYASNLVAGDTNNEDDVFLIDRQLGTIERENVTSSGAQGVGGQGYSSMWPTVTDDGRYVGFLSTQPNLNVYNQNLITTNIAYLRDRSTGTTELISQNPTCQALIPAGNVPYVTNDARFVVADTTYPIDPQDTNTNSDAYLRDRSIPFGRLSKHCHK